MAFPTGWSHKWPIDINADSVISAPVADWPCLVTDAHFPAGAWAEMQATGADLRFSSDEAGTVELYYDDPRLDVAGESAHLYVGVPSLAASADTTIYAWVGNDSAAAPTTAWKQNTYPADIVAWWPMEEGAGGTVYDRTANGADAGIVGTSWSWVEQADGSWALDFGTGADRVEVPVGSTAASPGTSDFSVLWRSEADVNAKDRNYFDGRAWNSPYTGWNIRRAGNATSLVFELNGGTRYTYPFNTAAETMPVGTAISMACSFDRDGQTVVLRDGAEIGAASISGSAAQNIAGGDNPNKIGGHHRNSSGDSFDGRFFAVAVLLRTVTPDEAALHHLMLSSPATFATAGELVAVGSTGRAYFAGPNLGNSLFRRANL
ncbi:MAG TPA: hypothetical protein VFC82_11220 [Actinomycetaceae bacterium]|nr:hypothetical protein [Actinomycetaceae bacterium]